MSGKMVRGTLAASDPEALLNELKKKDLFLLDYTQTSKTSFGSKLKAKELTDFCRQLGSLLDAGVSVIQSFNIISNRASISKFARKCFSDITTDLKHGKALSDAMADQGKVFPELLISMVRAGEASGKIGDTFINMGEHFQKQQRIKSQVKGALAYPPFRYRQQAVRRKMTPLSCGSATGRNISTKAAGRMTRSSIWTAAISLERIP